LHRTSKSRRQELTRQEWAAHGVARDRLIGTAVSRYRPWVSLSMRDALPPSSDGQAQTALCTTASQNLAAIGSSHSLTETVHLGALTLLGLIGTEHCMTPPLKNIGDPTRTPYSTAEKLCRSRHSLRIQTLDYYNEGHMRLSTQNSENSLFPRKCSLIFFSYGGYYQIHMDIFRIRAILYAL